MAGTSRAARPGFRLLLLNGIGASLELPGPFAAAVSPAVEVIRFDVPGVGGSPLPPRLYRLTGLCQLTARMLTGLAAAASTPIIPLINARP